VGKSAETIWGKVKRNPKNVRFSDFCRLIQWFGFQKKGGKGSHQTYFLPGIREILDVQSLHGEAKPYQIKQLVRLVKEYDLKGRKERKS